MKYVKKPATEDINISNVTKELLNAVMKMSPDDKFVLTRKITGTHHTFSNYYNPKTIAKEVIEMVMKMSLEEKCKLLGELKTVKGKSRRQYTREHYVTPVHFAVKGILLNGYTKNISKGGVFIETTRAKELNFAVGDPVTMNFTHPQFRNPLKISGKIARVSKVGIGIQFDEYL